MKNASKRRLKALLPPPPKENLRCSLIAFSFKGSSGSQKNPHSVYTGGDGMCRQVAGKFFLFFFIVFFFFLFFISFSFFVGMAQVYLHILSAV